MAGDQVMAEASMTSARRCYSRHGSRSREKRKIFQQSHERVYRAFLDADTKE